MQEGAGPEQLADVAYGIFEILLNKELRLRGSDLFVLVENGEDFRTLFDEIFQKFSNEYPDLARVLTEKFGNTTAIYDLLRAGEGVIPTKTTQMYWVIQDAPAILPTEVNDELAGKWLIFLEGDRVDEAWKKIRDATIRGELGISAKVSTAKPNPESRDDRKVIYVYTKDWRDEVDVMRVRENLRAIGFVDRLGYKRNIETFRGEYSKKGKRITYYSA
ncbi:MAG: DUF1917 domain-containing protein [Methanomicrobiales archaeon]|nr:DUF1917 domain-containing protein [Methanomicrobiales archaeon]